MHNFSWQIARGKNVTRIKMPEMTRSSRRMQGLRMQGLRMQGLGTSLDVTVAGTSTGSSVTSLENVGDLGLIAHVKLVSRREEHL